MYCVACPAAQVTTEKMIRKQLEKQLGIDLGDKKAFIREQVPGYCLCRCPVVLYMTPRALLAPCCRM